eukprot:1185306-Prorocentrum_minimum.AAC.1
MWRPTIRGRIEFSGGRMVSYGLNGQLSSLALFQCPRTFRVRSEFSGGGAARNSGLNRRVEP